MKKKFLPAVLLLAVTFLLTGCGLFTVRPADENFPYDAAVAQGETQSEADWLSGLQDGGGSEYFRLWKEAKENGEFDGGYVEFLKELGLSDSTPSLNRALLASVLIEAYYSDNTGDGGSGVILSVDKTKGDMYVLTNFHVVNMEQKNGGAELSDTIYVWLYGRNTTKGTMQADYVGGSADYDLALLKIDGSKTVKISSQTTSEEHTNADVLKDSDACAVTIGNSDCIAVSEDIYAVGNAAGWGLSVVKGVVSVDAEYIDMTSPDGSGKELSMLEMRIDAPVNHGNSGGGIFNAAGELVGILNARSEKSGVVGIGYAIPVNEVLAVVGNFTENGGKVKLARLAITTLLSDSKTVYNETTGQLFIEEKHTVQSVELGGAGSAAGLQRNDTICAAIKDGVRTDIVRRHQLTNFLLSIRKGDTVSLEVSRGGEILTLTVTFDKDTYFETL